MAKLTYRFADECSHATELVCRAQPSGAAGPEQRRVITIHSPMVTTLSTQWRRCISTLLFTFFKLSGYSRKQLRKVLQRDPAKRGYWMPPGVRTRDYPLAFWFRLSQLTKLPIPTMRQCCTYIRENYDVSTFRRHDRLRNPSPQLSFFTDTAVFGAKVPVAQKLKINRLPPVPGNFYKVGPVQHGNRTFFDTCIYWDDDDYFRITEAELEASFPSSADEDDVTPARRRGPRRARNVIDDSDDADDDADDAPGTSRDHGASSGDIDPLGDIEAQLEAALPDGDSDEWVTTWSAPAE